MIIYHGSTDLVEKPEIRAGKSFLDFGNGFYATTSFDQAERWARIKMKRENKTSGFVSIYEFDFDVAKEHSAIQIFDSADMEWLLFVVNNRRGIPYSEAIDMHVAPVADDNVYQSIRFLKLAS